MSTSPLPRPEIQRRNGFAPLPNECLWDWARLASGDAQLLSILFINSEIHVFRKKGDPPLKWTRAISNEELAQFARCTVRAIEIAIGDLTARKVINRKKAGKAYAYQIPWETWSELPDRPSKVVVLGEAEPAEEESEDEAKRPKGQVLAVFSKPQKVRAGGRTKPKDLPAAAGRLQFEAESEIEFDARMCDGILTIRAKSEEIAKRTSTKGEDKRNRFRNPDTQVLDSKHHSNFHLFETAWLKHGINAAPDDWSGARAAWLELDTAQQLAAVKGVHDRFEQGEYDPKEPKWIHLPQNYLRKKLWMRPVRPRKTSGGKDVMVFKNAATVRAAHEWAEKTQREIDAKKRITK